MPPLLVLNWYAVCSVSMYVIVLVLVLSCIIRERRTCLDETVDGQRWTDEERDGDGWYTITTPILSPLCMYILWTLQSLAVQVFGAEQSSQLHPSPSTQACFSLSFKVSEWVSWMGERSWRFIFMNTGHHWTSRSIIHSWTPYCLTLIRPAMRPSPDVTVGLPGIHHHHPWSLSHLQ